MSGLRPGHLLLTYKNRIQPRDGRPEMLIVKALVPARATERAAGWDVIEQFVEPGLEADIKALPGIYACELEQRPMRGKLESVITGLELVFQGFPEIASQ